MSWRGVVLMPWGGPKVRGVSMSWLGSRCPQGQQCPEGADSRQGTNSLGIPMPLERNNPARGHPGKVSPPPQRSHISANLRAAPAWKIPLFPHHRDGGNVPTAAEPLPARSKGSSCFLKVSSRQAALSALPGAPQTPPREEIPIIPSCWSCRHGTLRMLS